MVHHAVKGMLEHMDGGCGWGLWSTVGWVGHGLAVGGHRFRFEDDLWDG